MPKQEDWLQQEIERHFVSSRDVAKPAAASTTHRFFDVADFVAIDSVAITITYLGWCATAAHAILSP